MDLKAWNQVRTSQLTPRSLHVSFMASRVIPSFCRLLVRVCLKTTGKIVSILGTNEAESEINKVKPFFLP